MRQVIVSVPANRQAEVLDCLQGSSCEIKNCVAHCDGILATVYAFIQKNETGPVLHHLDKIGVGTAYGKIVVVPVVFAKPLPPFRRMEHLAYLGQRESWSVRGRLSIEEIYENVLEGCTASFDYLVLVSVASAIAFVGLLTDNAVMIVASMLVSPLMGPILGFTFGTSLRDVMLIKRGLVAEAIGILACFLVGFVGGLVVCPWTPWPQIETIWPTGQMVSRGDWKSLISGVAFAIPSGLGVAVSVTMGGPTAIVGVAIAASLLPPVVNADLCLAYARVGDKRKTPPYDPGYTHTCAHTHTHTH
ncbi:hypothetical protein FOA52_007531 [Chlamydomonas sp. UWO 241]|nr:hypothetical protein FOA52_007531 [Chlamydomonas sp. UWO 241]